MYCKCMRAHFLEVSFIQFFFRFGFLLTEMFEMRMCFFLRINMRIIMQWNAMALVYFMNNTQYLQCALLTAL